jgi:hypothetical protein
MKKKTPLMLFFVTLTILALVAFPSSASADHSWRGFHWARTTKSFTLALGENLSSDWEPYLATASSDWSRSKVLDTAVTGGQTTDPQACSPSLGRVEVCNGNYGYVTWIGLARVWINGSHIVQGAVLMNDFYFDMPRFNTSAWKNLVMCQEIGHTFGLDHQDEDFYNEPLGTCMDYTADPEPNQHPNRHDYEQLQIIYEHLDSTSTVGPLPADVANATFANRSDWGRLVKSEGQTAIYERTFANGYKVVTFVIWAQE